MTTTADLDQTDWKILKILQDEGRITNVELARRVGISAPPCLRRVKRLEDSGIIERSVERQFRTFRVRRESMLAISDWLERYKRFWNRSFDRLEKLLDSQEKADEHDE